jgi:hypothetical protein
MSSSVAAPRRGLASRAQENRPVTKSVQLNVNDDTFRRLRIRTGRLPVSFAAGDEDKLRCEVSKSPYYSLLARAVSQLPKNTRTARLALYDRAEVALPRHCFIPKYPTSKRPGGLPGGRPLSFSRTPTTPHAAAPAAATSKGLAMISSNRITCTEDHLPPRAAGMPRSSRPAARARND